MPTHPPTSHKLFIILLCHRCIPLAFAIGILLYSFSASLYAATENPCDTSEFGCFEVGLPGGKEEGDITTQTTIDSFVAEGSPLIRFTKIIINFITAIIIIIGLITIVVSGYVYMTAGGSGARVTTAKGLMGAALLGITIALTAWLILNTISPQFTTSVKEPTLLFPTPTPAP